MGNFYVGMILNGNRVYPKTMVLCGYFALTSNNIFNGVIKASVTMVHLKSRNTICQSQQLMAQTDSKYRLVFSQNIFYRLNSIGHGSRVAWTIRDKVSGWIKLL